MEATSLLQSFAIAKDGRVVSVEEVERGQACGCTCPACQRPLIARQGELRVWHFAHATGADCEGGAESALHLAAKTVIERAGGVTLPGLTAQRTLTLPDGRRGTGEASISETWIDFTEVRTEVNLGDVIPDVVGTAGTQAYLIEVGVTHFVDTGKLAILKASGNPAIEIDLRGVDRVAWDWPALEEIVVHGVSGKHWLAYPGHEALVVQATERARAAAEALPLLMAPEAPQKAKPTRTRYWPDGRIVDLVDFPFGVALWSPYDAQFNEVVKAWCRRFGGRWQRSHKNWLFPLQAKPFLVAEIAKRQPRQPSPNA